MDYISTRKQIEDDLIRIARNNKEFEKLLFSDPTTALEKIGIFLPPGLTLRVIREQENEVILVYPATNAAEELSELELIHASGGSRSRINTSS